MSLASEDLSFTSEAPLIGLSYLRQLLLAHDNLETTRPFTLLVRNGPNGLIYQFRALVLSKILPNTLFLLKSMEKASGIRNNRTDGL